MKYLLVVIMVLIQLSAQTHLFKSTGEIKRIDKKQKSQLNNNATQTSAFGTIDTVDFQHLGLFDTEISLNNSQDILVQWFIMPADLIIKAVGFRCSQSGAPIHLRLIRSNWISTEMENLPHPKQLGYYLSEGDGFNNVSPFPDETTGGWVDKSGGELSEPFDSSNFEVWDMGGLEWPYFPEEKGISDLSYQFYETSNSGYEPDVHANSVIGIVIELEDNEETKFWSVKKPPSPTYSIPGWKYFEYGDESSNGPGWWISDYVFDFAMIVELVSGPRIVISDLTHLLTTLSTEPREVCCLVLTENPSGGPSGVEEVELIYTVNNGPEISIEMDSVGNVNYCGEIPGQQPGDEIIYYVRVTDINGYSASSSQYFYKIFDPNPEADALLVFNGSDGYGYPEQYYFRDLPEFKYDIWAYGELTEELINNYSDIYEFCSSGPKDDNKQAIWQWLNSDLTHNYFLSGDEFLGRFHDYKDSSFLPGDFEYDVLGIEHSYNDVSYDGSNGQDSISALFPVEGSILTEDLFHYLRNEGHDSVLYNPIFEIGLTNWIDAFEPIDSTEVQMFVKTRGINNQPAVEIKPTLIARKYNSSNKIVFAGFDTFSLDLDSSPHSRGENYFWIGDTTLAPHYQALSWFNEPVNVKEENVINNFHLSQNYPNPFNPTTRIKYQVASIEIVSLKVYDILGREVITLINKPMQPGEYEVTFEGSNLPSGVYFYRLNTGDFSQTRKMLLLK